MPMSAESQSIGIPARISPSQGFGGRLVQPGVSQTTPQAVIPQFKAPVGPSQGFIAPPSPPKNNGGPTAEYYQERQALQKANNRPQVYR